jgi:hypothetical protein
MPHEDGSLAPKHVGDGHLMFVVIKIVHLVDIISGVR